MIAEDAVEKIFKAGIGHGDEKDDEFLSGETPNALKVKVISGSRLSASDPYVVIRLGGRKKSTRVSPPFFSPLEDTQI